MISMIADFDVVITVTIARDPVNEMGVESENFPTPVRNLMDMALLRYDSNHTYYIRG